MKKSLLLSLLPLSAAACSLPAFVASKTVEFEIPAAYAKQLHCETHNGDITVTAATADEPITVRATIKVRGHSQREADDNLHKMSIVHHVDGETVRLVRQYPTRELSGFSPSYDFTLSVPASFGLELHTHNGDVATSGTRGALTAHSHNGDIVTQVASDAVRLDTHNGDIRLAIVDEPQPAASVETHNGNVEIVVPESASCALEAHTHNGSIRLPERTVDADMRRRDARGRIGAPGGEARVYVKTHNGNVTIR